MNNIMKMVISDCILDMTKYNIKIILSNTKSVVFGLDSNDKSNGYFCDDPKEFVVAINKPQKQWIPTFLHEYNHFLQWKENSKYWNNCKDGFLDYWLSGHNISDRVVNRGINSMIDLELDCEKRTVDMIKRLNLPINLDWYIKTANAYVLYYNILKESRQWYIIAPYDVKEILDSVPNYWLDDYSKTPLKYKQLVLKYCFNKKA